MSEPSDSRSFAWHYFTKVVKEECATCNKCGAKLKCKGWSTSGLNRHLQARHAINESVHKGNKRSADASTICESSKRQKVQPTLTNLFKPKETLQEIVSKLAAVDGMSINTITNSRFIRSALADKGFTLPKNHSHVMNLIYSEHQLRKNDVIELLSKMLMKGSRFSLSLDEYTSIRNRRYLNINVHGNNGKFWNLGMIRIHGSLPAEAIVDSVESRLKEFGISLADHIVSCVTDGASVMTKFGKLVPCEHNLCYSHGIHLAVCDILYDSKDISIEESSLEMTNQDVEDDYDDTDYELPVAEISLVTGNVKVSVVIEKVRKISRLFRKSPLKNETLQKYVMDSKGKQLQLMLDSRTRWNSLIDMLDRYKEIRQEVSKALIDCARLDLDLSNSEFEVVKTVLLCMLPIKTGAESLGCRKMTLFSSEAVFHFMLEELKEVQSELSGKMRESLITRINQRRNVFLIGAISYLQLGSKYQPNREVGLGLSKLPSKTAIREYLKTQSNRLSEKSESPKSTSCADEETTDPPVPKSLVEKLNDRLRQIEDKELTNSSNLNLTCLNSLTYFSKECEMFENTGEKTLRLRLLHENLKTVPPTSIESERAFSSFGLYVTKLRSRLGDRSIDSLCFLKTFYAL